MNKLLRILGFKKASPTAAVLKAVSPKCSAKAPKGLNLSDRKYSEEELLYGVQKLDVTLPEYWESSSSSSCSSGGRHDVKDDDPSTGSDTLDSLVFRTRPTSVLTDDSPLEYSDDEGSDFGDDNDDTAVSAGLQPYTHPVEFSEDPEFRAREMFELAEDMIEHALRVADEHKQILDEFQAEQIEYSLERLNEFRDRLEIFENDSPIARLLRIELFIADAGDFLKRVLLMVHTAQDAEYDEEDN